MLRAMGRRSAGKQSETMEVEGGVAPASPTPGADAAHQELPVRSTPVPHKTVKPDHSISDAATMLRRLERSANQAIGMPQTT